MHESIASAKTRQECRLPGTSPVRESQPRGSNWNGVLNGVLKVLFECSSLQIFPLFEYSLIEFRSTLSGHSSALLQLRSRIFRASAAIPLVKPSKQLVITFELRSHRRRTMPVTM